LPTDNCPDSWLTALCHRAASARHRYSLLLCGGAEWRQQRLDQLFSTHPAACCLRLDSDQVSLAEARRLLGREFVLAELSGGQPPAPDLLAIVAGTLRGGGLLIFNFHGPSGWSGAFDRWLWRCIAQDGAVLRLAEGAPLPPLPPALSARLATPDAMGCRSRGQRRAVDGVLQVVHGHRRRPLVITAERGRGKSAALGIAAAALLSEGRRRILVTAPKRAAVDALFERVVALLPDGSAQKDRWCWQQGEIGYLAPDQLLQQLPEADLLLVDEAAAIPAPLLARLLNHYARIVFATTTQGYEGTGRGFALRFRQVLAQQTPGWNDCTITEPIRWANGDPLERWLYRTLLLDAEPANFAPELSASGSALRAACTFERWGGAQLLEEPALLQQLFALLVQAHYQTTPNDLRDLLQGEAREVWLLRYRGQVAGGLLTVREGGLDGALATDVWLGQRRPAGHLLPQTLIAQAGWLQAGALHYLRVVRIAVHPQLQRQGLGGWMLERLAAAAEGVDLLGSSFAASDHLPRFWTQAGYRALRLGLQRDAASGCHSLLVARPLTAAGAQLLQRIEPRYQQQLRAQLHGAYREVEPALLAELLRAAPPSEAPVAEQDALDLIAYVLGGRGFEQVEPVLHQFLLRQLQRNHPWSAAELALLIRRILQRHTVAECCRLAGLSGRRQLEQRLRQLLLERVTRELLPCLSSALLQRVRPLLEP